MLLSALCFDRSVPKEALSENTSPGGWSFWPFKRKQARATSPPSPPTPETNDTTNDTSPQILEEVVPEAATGEVPAKKKGDDLRIKSLYPTSTQLHALGLKEGQNAISFTIGRSGTTVDGFVYLWPSDAKIVISDVDGTVTKSDVLGHILPNLGRDWSHAGICRLLNEITGNGYHLMYLTSRALGQASMTRDYLQWVQQDGTSLPQGPVIMSPDGLIQSFTREVAGQKPTPRPPSHCLSPPCLTRASTYVLAHAITSGDPPSADGL